MQEALENLQRIVKNKTDQIFLFEFKVTVL